MSPYYASLNNGKIEPVKVKYTGVKAKESSVLPGD
jgi:hypothetical protein